MTLRLRTLRGFTLIEVMVGIVLMSIGLIGMAALTSTVALSNRGAANRTRADQLIHEKIEELRTISYDLIATGQDTIDVSGVEIVRVWTVTDNTPVADIKQIQLVGSWQETGRSFSMRTVTLVGRN